MTEKQKILIEYKKEVAEALYGLKTFCINNGIQSKPIKQTEAIEFYCKQKSLATPSVEDELGFVLDVYFSNECEYIKSNSKIIRKRHRVKFKQKPVRLSSIEFYQSNAWLSLRKKVFRKYGKSCMKCGKTKACMHVDHIKPRSLFPKLELSFKNLQVLCKECNLEKSNLHFTDYRKVL